MDARLLIATTNPAKLSQYRLLLAAYPLRLISLRELGIEQEPEETGAGFIENALIKARYYFELARISTLADDGGLEVDALGGALLRRAARARIATPVTKRLVDELEVRERASTSA